MDWVVHGVAKSQTQLSDFHFTYTHTPTHSEDLAEQGATHRGMQRETTRAEEAASKQDDFHPNPCLILLGIDGHCHI